MTKMISALPVVIMIHSTDTTVAEKMETALGASVPLHENDDIIVAYGDYSALCDLKCPMMKSQVMLKTARGKTFGGDLSFTSRSKLRRVCTMY